MTARKKARLVVPEAKKIVKDVLPKGQQREQKPLPVNLKRIKGRVKK